MLRARDHKKGQHTRKREENGHDTRIRLRRMCTFATLQFHGISFAWEIPSWWHKRPASHHDTFLNHLIKVMNRNSSVCLAHKCDKSFSLEFLFLISASKDLACVIWSEMIPLWHFPCLWIMCQRLDQMWKLNLTLLRSNGTFFKIQLTLKPRKTLHTKGERTYFQANSIFHHDVNF